MAGCTGRKDMHEPAELSRNISHIQGLYVFNDVLLKMLFKIMVAKARRHRIVTIFLEQHLYIMDCIEITTNKLFL